MHFYREKEASLNRPCALYSPISETFWRRHSYGDRRKISDFQGAGAKQGQTDWVLILGLGSPLSMALPWCVGTII